MFASPWASCVLTSELSWRAKQAAEPQHLGCVPREQHLCNRKAAAKRPLRKVGVGERAAAHAAAKRARSSERDISASLSRRARSCKELRPAR